MNASEQNVELSCTLVSTSNNKCPTTILPWTLSTRSYCCPLLMVWFSVSGELWGSLLPRRRHPPHRSPHHSPPSRPPGMYHAHVNIDILRYTVQPLGLLTACINHIQQSNCFTLEQQECMTNVKSHQASGNPKIQGHEVTEKMLFTLLKRTVIF